MRLGAISHELPILPQLWLTTGILSGKPDGFVTLLFLWRHCIDKQSEEEGRLGLRQGSSEWVLIGLRKYYTGYTDTDNHSHITGQWESRKKPPTPFESKPLRSKVVTRPNWAVETFVKLLLFLELVWTFEVSRINTIRSLVVVHYTCGVTLYWFTKHIYDR